MGDVMLVYMVFRAGSGMSLWSMSTIDFVKDYVARKVMHALAEKWPSMEQNYRPGPEWRFEAVLEEVYSTGEAPKKKKGTALEPMSEDEMILEIWVTPKLEPTYGVSSLLGKSLLLVRMAIPYSETIPDDIITLSLHVRGLVHASVELDFRTQDQGHPPAFIQAHNLAFMLVIQADKMAYRILELTYNPDSTLVDNITECIWFHCQKWDYPVVPSDIFYDPYDDFHRIGIIIEDSLGNSIEHGLLDFMETSEMYTLRSCREGELTLSFLKSKNTIQNICGVFSSYYAVMEIMSRAKGIDIFYVHEKFRNSSSVDCSSCILNGVDNSGFKVFLYMDVGVSFEEASGDAGSKPSEAPVEAGDGTSEAPVEAGDGPSKTPVEADNEPSEAPASAQRTPRYLGFFDRPAWVGIDLPPGTMHELQLADYEAKLVDAVRGAHLSDVPDSEAEHGSAAEEPTSRPAEPDPHRDAVPDRKRRMGTYLQIMAHVARQPEVKIVPASSFKPREPLSAEIVQKLKAYTEEIDWDNPLDQKYVDNLVNRLYELYSELQVNADVQATINGIESELNQTIDESRKRRERQLEALTNAEVRMRREEARRKSIAHRKFVQTFLYHDPSLFYPRTDGAGQPVSTRRSRRNPLFGTPSAQAAAAVKQVPAEWERWYKTHVSEEEHRVLVVMQQSNTYRSVAKLEGGPERRGNASMFINPEYRFLRANSIEEVVFVCRAIGYFPTYYVYGTTLFFPTDELKKFTVLVNQWCMQMNPEKLRKSAEQSENREVFLKELEELRPVYEKVSRFKRSMPKIAAEESAPPAPPQLTADMYIMALCGMVEKLMDDSGRPPRRPCG
jgi:hypothetical protein